MRRSPQQIYSGTHATTRVVHLTPRLFGFGGGVLGGAERYVFELARHMAEKTETTLITFGDKSSEETVGPLRVRVIGEPWYVRRQKGNPLSLRMLSSLSGADVVHCHQQHILSSSLAAAFCRATRRRVFVSDLGGGGWDVSAYLSTDCWYNGHLHISEYSRFVFGHQNRPWAHVISGGVDTEKFCSAEPVVTNNAAVFVGRLLPHKGIDDLINAAPEDIPVEIIGQPYHPAYFEHLMHLAIGKRVNFRSDCGDEEIVEAYRGALCVVLPSVYRTMYGEQCNVPELLGQTLLEGMACGVPAICSNVASMPEVVEDGVTGFVVPPNDPIALRSKLQWLRNHPERGRQMGLAGRQRVLEHFTWSAVVDRCLKIYSSVQ